MKIFSAIHEGLLAQFVACYVSRNLDEIWAAFLLDPRFVTKADFSRIKPTDYHHYCDEDSVEFEFVDSGTSSDPITR